MGNILESCKQHPSHEVDTSKNMEEWYDPFSELKKKVITKRGVLNNNRPRDCEFVDHLPPHIIKK